MDPTERDLTGLDVDRPLPPALRDRLEAALRHEATTRPIPDETAALLGDLDRPLPLPVSTRRSLEQALIASPRRSPVAGPGGCRRRRAARAGRRRPEQRPHSSGHGGRRRHPEQRA